MALTPYDRKISDIFKKDGSYDIDFYQREYKWNKDAVNALLDDIFSKFDENYNENIEYSTSTSRLYKEEGIYKAIFNLSQTRINEDFENDTKTEQDYGLFLIISSNNKPLETLTIEQYSYIKFVLDSYDEYNGYE